MGTPTFDDLDDALSDFIAASQEHVLYVSADYDVPVLRYLLGHDTELTPDFVACAKLNIPEHSQVKTTPVRMRDALIYTALSSTDSGYDSGAIIRDAELIATDSTPGTTHAKLLESAIDDVFYKHGAKRLEKLDIPSYLLCETLSADKPTITMLADASAFVAWASGDSEAANKALDAADGDTGLLGRMTGFLIDAGDRPAWLK